MRIDKKERNILIGMFVILTLWFAFLLGKYYEIANGNAKMFYFLFLFLYCFLVSKFFFNESKINAVFIFFIVILISDVLLPPYLIVKDIAPTLADNLKFSSDYFIYSLFPMDWGHNLKYYLTYIAVPILMWGIIALLFDRKKFMSLLKTGL
jgi:hypothetical protein